MSSAAGKRSWLLGLDIGGGGGRSLFYAPSDGTVVVASRGWSARSAPDTAGLGFDLDLDQALHALATATREAIDKAGIDPSDIEAIACSAMRIGTVVLGSDGPLFATTNRDARAVLEGLTLAAEHGDTFYARTGRWPYPIFPAARLQWLAANRADDMARATACFALSDWLGWALTGVVATDPTQAGETLVYDLAERRWAEDLIEMVGLAPSLFPEVKEPADRLGTVGREVAGAFGLRVGTPVFVGGGDSQCALLATGVARPGSFAVVGGTTAPVTVLTDASPGDDTQRLWGGHFLNRGTWMLESSAGPLGETLDWLARVFHPTARAPVAKLLAEAGAAQSGAAGFFSTVGVQVQDAKNMGLPAGDLTLTHVTTTQSASARSHVERAVVDGLAYGVKANVGQLIEASGYRPTEVALAGGLSRSGEWAETLAAVLEVPIRVAASPHTSALGAALLAGVGAAAYDDLAAAAAKAREAATVVAPTPDRVALHKELYPRWSEQRGLKTEATTKASEQAIPLALALNDSEARPARGAFRPKILVTADMDDASLERLAAMGDVEYASFRQVSRLLTGPSLVEALAGVHVFITEIDLVDTAALSKLDDLRVVAACRSDAVNVHVDACTAFGIPVLNAPGRNAAAVADCAVAYVLMLARKLVAANAFLRFPGGEPGDMARMGHAFSTLRGHELSGVTVGLVGLGAVGRQVTARLAGFGADVLVADPFITPGDAERVDARLVTLDELLSSSDIVSLHAAVTADTHEMIGARELSLMKTGAALVNTARAALVDEDALVAALSDGHLAGAALDVFRVEPPGAEDPLVLMDNVIVTPHVAGNTVEVAMHQGRIIADDLARLLDGVTPEQVLNPVVMDCFSWSERPAAPSETRIDELRATAAAAVSDLQRDADPSSDVVDTTVPPSALNGSRNVSLSAAAKAARSRMSGILELFCAGIADDEKIRSFSTENASDVTLHFRLTDVDLDFFCRLAGAELSARVEVPQPAAPVQLRMRADVLDGMFTGRLNPMEAAMDGRLSFTGDAAKAMTLQQLESELDRLYRSAREEAGDPGDLTSLGGTSKAPAVIACTGDRREEVCRIVGELYQSELITATGGNVSVRMEHGGRTLWITPSRMFKGEMSPDLLVGVNLDGTVIDEEARSPSSELLMHTAIFEAKPAAEAVIHCHAANATILANADLPFLPISTEAAFFADIPRVPFIMPGTTELAEAVGRAIGDGWAVLMKNHGLIVAGRSLRAAADMAEVIERSAEVMLGCYAVGKEPPVLPDHVIATLRKMGDMVA